jgi:hypothetical protein
MQNRGAVHLAGQVGLRPIRLADLPQTPAFLSRPRWRLSRAERLLRDARDLFGRLVRPEDLADECRRLEEALGLRVSAVGLERAQDRERVLRAYYKALTARLMGRFCGAVVLDSCLALAVRRQGRAAFAWQGIASRKVVTSAGVAFLVDAWQNIVELESMRFHGVGEGDTGPEDVADTDLEAELTTEYAPDNTRATGTLAEAAANIFRTVGTNAFDAPVALVEHGLFSSATVGAGVLWDRSVFAVINLGNGEALQSTYDLTVSAGG